MMGRGFSMPFRCGSHGDGGDMGGNNPEIDGEGGCVRKSGLDGARGRLAVTGALIRLSVDFSDGKEFHTSQPILARRGFLATLAACWAGFVLIGLML